ncbi:aspartyl protease family protein [Candidatus Acetothermia bacterium]|nr:aspartyl protease family protein [Candidatus Acetothermia bacterium]
MMTEASFRLAGGAQPLMLVPAFVNGKGPYEFILDTGAGTSLLTSELARQLGITPTETKEGMGAGGKVKVSLGKVESLAIGQAKIKEIQVAITEELQKIGAVIGAKIDGNIGYNYLRNFCLTLDYAKGTLRLIHAEDERMDPELKADAQIKFRLAHPAKPLILVPTLVNGKGPYQFALDTGASTTVISPELAQNLSIKSTSAAAMTGGGGKVQAAIGRVESLAVGGAKVEDLPVMVADFLVMLSQATGSKLDGIIGYNFLKEFRVTLDYPNERVCLM